MIAVVLWAVFVLLALRVVAACIFIALVFAGARYDWREDGRAFRIACAVGRVAVFPHRPRADNQLDNNVQRL